MSGASQADAVGVVCRPGAADRAMVMEYLAGRKIEQARWFAPGELHDLDREVRRGRVGRVIFGGLADLLEGIWEEEIVFEEWPMETGIEFVEPPGENAVRLMGASWLKWRRRHRRRQAIAGAVLSAVILAASFVLCVVLAR